MSEVSDELLRKAAHLHHQNQLAEALVAYGDIVARWPNLADAWYNLAVVQRQTSRWDEALASYQKALSAGIARPEEVHLNRSVIFSDFLHDHPAAAAELQQALTLNPGYTPALLNLANLYEDLGRRAEASSLYARILILQPQAFEALARFANLQEAAGIDSVLVKRLKEALGAATSVNDIASLGFSLGRLLDAGGDYRGAFRAYTAANRASRASAAAHIAPYDRDRHTAFIDRLIGGGLSGARADRTDIPPRPIFIVGMFRSGSTLAEQLLAGLPGVAGGGELDFLPRLVNTELNPIFQTSPTLSPERLNSLAARHRAELLRVSTIASYVTDKRPDNFLYIGLIKRLFPKAKIVHTTRNALDNCLSIFFLHLDQRMSYALSLKDIGHYYQQYRRLMAHWKSEHAGDIFDFDYDALVKHPQAQMKALCEFLNLPWSGVLPSVASRGRPIKTASVWQVREPLYTRSSGRASHYVDELDQLRAELGM